MKTRLHKRVSRMIRGRLQRRLLSRNGVGILAETENGLYVVEPGDFGIARHLLENGAYDRQDLLWLNDALDGAAGTIVVVGAHVGTVLIPLARIARRAIGFEPDPVNFRLAGLNLLLNRIDNVTLVNKAVGAHEGTAEIRHNAINTGNSAVAPPGRTRGHEVDMTALDTGLRAFSEGIDLLVVDVEGYEVHVLRGAETTLRRTRMLYLEYAPEQLAEHGSSGHELIDMAFHAFSFLYVFDRRVRALGEAAAREYLDQEGRKRGFLRNLLFSKSPLTSAALSREGARP